MGDPGVDVLVVHCDGGARGNPGPAAAACVIDDVARKVRYLCGKYLGRATNNQAEYEAVKLALEVIKENYPDPKDVDFYLDSLLVTEQLRGLFKIKNPKLRELFFEVRSLETSLGKVHYHYIKREKNLQADSLVNRSIDEKRSFVEKEAV